MPFAEPTRTRFDLNFIVLGVPVRVHPLFWLMAIIFGLSGRSLSYILIWVAVVFVSILVHELGHSMAMRYFGSGSRIVLYHFGGLAIPDGMSWRSLSRTPNEQIIISFAGPLAGFLLAGLVIGLSYIFGGTILFSRLLGFIPMPNVFVPEVNGLVNVAIRALLWVNIFWGLINLIPVLPLDGGNISRAIFIQVDPLNGAKNALWLSVISGGIVAAVGFLLLNSTYMGLLFALLAYQSYQILQGGTGRLF